jgi:ferredoxin
MTILQVIENNKAAKVECLCREGVCGTCETMILEKFAAGTRQHQGKRLSAFILNDKLLKVQLTGGHLMSRPAAPVRRPRARNPRVYLRPGGA